MKTSTGMIFNVQLVTGKWCERRMRRVVSDLIQLIENEWKDLDEDRNVPRSKPSVKSID